MSKTKTMFIPVIEGADRPKRQSLQVAKLVETMILQRQFLKTKLIDPNDYPVEFDGNDQENQNFQYQEIVRQADGFVVIVPEYNHSFPGVLKTLLDNELSLYRHKAVGFVGVSAGPWGGVRGIESLVNVVRELGLVAIDTDAHFPNVYQAFGSDGSLKDSSYERSVDKMLDELEWMTRVMAQARI